MWNHNKAMKSETNDTTKYEFDDNTDVQQLIALLALYDDRHEYVD